ncbi:hypothetical protein CHO01_17060 [Cellulomonas hominis]|uniref:Uncharacterized protein n=1 Tax=Cellulomonas hominis TaxID=156981 RepID=A0A511FBE6_9CELL|nr:hypothetical protein [Cellulomonas hominis]MBB5474552.1 hypothetical protein [Cellulomonas hominis]NKY05610.1 hypothetical protein [Cellulomonas hominis]GEL46590.1 hypothetical protein CHO01_17060 [Cellulomonas hominis]
MPTFIHTKPRARKAHTCCCCGRTIHPGEAYTRGVGLDRGAGAWTYRRCAHCAVAVGYVSGLTTAEEFEDRDLIETWEPDGIAENQVRRNVLQAQWRTPTGVLVPVPVLLHEDPAQPWRPTGIHIPLELL